MASLLRKLPSFSEIVAQVASPSSAGAAAEAVAEELRAVNAAGLVQSTGQLLSSTLSRSRLARQAPDLRWRAQIGGVVAESCCGRRRADGGANEDAEGEEWEWEHWVWLSVPAADAAAAEGDAARAPELSLQLLAGGAVQQPTASPDGERVVGSAMLPLATLAAHTSTPLTLPLLSPAAAAAAAAADGDAPAAADGIDSLRSDGDDDGDDGASVSALVGELRVRATYRPFGGREEAAVDEYGFRVPPAHAKNCPRTVGRSRRTAHVGGAMECVDAPRALRRAVTRRGALARALVARAWGAAAAPRSRVDVAHGRPRPPPRVAPLVLGDGRRR